MEHHTHEAQVPWAKFVIAVVLQLAAGLGVLWLIFPNVMAAEARQPWGILLWTVLFGLPLSLFEYLYHRYMLHSAVFPFMASMHRAHSTHHGLTSVKAPVTPKDPHRMVPVTSEFPIEEEHQEESMMFPLWSLPIFYGVFLILFALPAKLLFPAQPVLIGLMLSVTLYYSAYEVWHAVLHLPFERFWKPMLEARPIRKLTRLVYGFHLMHHWRPTSNLAIVGFWGIAIWDHTFRTHRRPDRLPLDGAEVNYHDAQLYRPLWPIRLFDRWQAPMYKASRRLERFLARVFLRRSARG